MNGFLEVASDELLKDVEHISYKKKGETHSFKVIGYDVQNQTFGGDNFKTVTFFGSMLPTMSITTRALFDWHFSQSCLSYTCLSFLANLLLCD